MRRLIKEPREEAQIEVERLRQSLSMDFFSLESHPEVVGLVGVQLPVFDAEIPTAFDDLNENSEASGGGLGPDPDPNLAGPSRPRGVRGNDNDEILPESRHVILPSTHMRDNKPLCKAELNLRIKQATRFLQAIRDAVAEKSFQYSHVLRSALSNGVRTRSRASIAKTNDRIAFYCRVYTRARAAMVRLGSGLGSDDTILETFKILQKDDVKASTAILNPNIPGSSNLRLSWIWQSGRSASGPDTMREC